MVRKAGAAATIHSSHGYSTLIPCIPPQFPARHKFPLQETPISQLPRLCFIIGFDKGYFHVSGPLNSVYRLRYEVQSRRGVQSRLCTRKRRSKSSPQPNQPPTRKIILIDFPDFLISDRGRAVSTNALVSTQMSFRHYALTILILEVFILGLRTLGQ